MEYYREAHNLGAFFLLGARYLVSMPDFEKMNNIYSRLHQQWPKITLLSEKKNCIDTFH
jgi:hypothetical protein